MLENLPAVEVLTVHFGQASFSTNAIEVVSNSALRGSAIMDYIQYTALRKDPGACLKRHGADKITALLADMGEYNVAAPELPGHQATRLRSLPKPILQPRAEVSSSFFLSSNISWLLYFVPFGHHFIWCSYKGRQKMVRNGAITISSAGSNGAGSGALVPVSCPCTQRPDSRNAPPTPEQRSQR